MAQQRYNKGVPFQTFSWAELSDEWKWVGRELTGMYLPLCGEVDVGTWLTLYANETNISGMWKMNMSPDPVKVYLIGDSGEVSVTVEERSTKCPVGRYDNQFIKSKTYSNSVDGNQISHDVFIQIPTDISERGNGTCVKITVRKSNETTIQKINWGTYDYNYPTVSTMYSTDSLVSSGVTNPAQARPWNLNSDTINKQRQYGLSVFFTSQGILTYNSNKDTVNPKLRT